MLRTPTLFALVLFSLLTGNFLSTASFLSTANAQVFNCNGVISNRPCDQYLTPIPKADVPESLDRSKKSSLINNLITKAISASNDYGVEVDYSEASDVCHDPASSLDDCRAIVNATDDKIESRLAARNYEKTNQDSDQPSGNTSGQNTEINIVQNNDDDDPYYIPPPLRRTPRDDRRDDRPTVERPGDISGIAGQIPEFPRRVIGGGRR